MKKIGQSLLENIRNYIWNKAKKNELFISCETVQPGSSHKAFRLSHYIVCLTQGKTVGSYEICQIYAPAWIVHKSIQDLEGPLRLMS